MKLSFLLSTLLASVTITLSPLSHALESIKIGLLPGVNSDAVQALAPEAEKVGLQINVVEFTDWTLPNEALNNGDIDLNFFQHQAFLNNAIKERGYQLELIGLGLLQNAGLYSERIKHLDELKQGAQVAIPNDPVNQGRGLLLLQQAGLISLKTGNKPGATVHDISQNPKQLRFHEVEGPQLIHSLPDVDLAVVWPSYFVNAGKPEQAGTGLAYSGIDDSFYAMGFAARSDRKQDPALLKLVELYQQSPAVKEVISKSYNHNQALYTLPWKQP